MRFGLDCSQHQLTWEELLERVRFAEAAGFDGAWVFDHFKPLYGEQSGPCLEGWTLLAALAAHTRRIRLGALVTGVTYRHPSLLAAEALTVDHVSNGRLEFGIGAAWFQQEHEQLGFDFPSTSERARRLEEAVQVMRLLLSGEVVSFDGRHYQLRNAQMRPIPVQQPHPPVWIGARGKQLMLPVVGRAADVWHTFGDPNELTTNWQIVREHAERAGRDPAEIAISTWLNLSRPWDEVERAITAYAEAGVSYLTVSWPSEGRAHLEHFTEHVLSRYSD